MKHVVKHVGHLEENCPLCERLSRPGYEAVRALLRLPDPAGGLVVNHAARGLGDAVLGLCAVAALEAANPGRGAAYRVAPAALPFVALFTGCDALLAQRPGTAAGGPPPGAPHGELQLNAGWLEEDRAKCPAPRVSRYCRNLGVPGPVLPAPRDPRGLAGAGAPFAGCVVLAPFSAHRLREYHLNGWLTLERLLRDAGHETLVVGQHGHGPRCGAFRGRKLLGAPAPEVTAALRAAACVVGNDSGLTHLSGLLGTPTVVLAGVTDPAKTHTPYARVTGVSGGWDCAGCFGQAPMRADCQPQCPCLQAIGPSRVTDAVGAWACRRAWPHTLLPPGKLAVLRRLVWDAPPGDLAELGVAGGGSALAMADAGPRRRLHLFDTFTGLPEDNPDGPHRAGSFARDEGAVRELLRDFDARTYPGLFPGTAPAGDVPIAVGHFDGDLEASCEAWVRWAWPRVVPGGFLVFDDCGAPEWPGVERAVRRHFPADVIETHAPLQAVVRKPLP